MLEVEVRLWGGGAVRWLVGGAVKGRVGLEGRVMCCERRAWRAVRRV